jgi:hypothetical protein
MDISCLVDCEFYPENSSIDLHDFHDLLSCGDVFPSYRIEVLSKISQVTMNDIFLKPIYTHAPARARPHNFPIILSDHACRNLEKWKAGIKPIITVNQV